MATSAYAEKSAEITHEGLICEKLDVMLPAANFETNKMIRAGENGVTDFEWWIFYSDNSFESKQITILATNGETACVVFYGQIKDVIDLEKYRSLFPQ
jgi:hypothetical protein